MTNIRGRHHCLHVVRRPGPRSALAVDRQDLALIVAVLALSRDRFPLACCKGIRLVDPRRLRLNVGSVLLPEDGHCLRDHTLAACATARP